MKHHYCCRRSDFYGEPVSAAFPFQNLVSPSWMRPCHNQIELNHEHRPTMTERQLLVLQWSNGDKKLPNAKLIGNIINIIRYLPITVFDMVRSRSIVRPIIFNWSCEPPKFSMVNWESSLVELRLDRRPANLQQREKRVEEFWADLQMVCYISYVQF